MARKQLERLLSEVAALADRLSEVDDALSAAELDEHLRETGSDPAALRRRLHEGVRTIMARLSEAGKPVPRYLTQVAEATAPLEEIASLSPKAAFEKLRGWVREMRDRASTPRAPISWEALAVLRAYRKTGDLTPDDARLLDKLEAQLKARAKEGQGGGEPGE
jgi:hypothetical protein